MNIEKKGYIHSTGKLGKWIGRLQANCHHQEKLRADENIPTIVTVGISTCGSWLAAGGCYLLFSVGGNPTNTGSGCRRTPQKSTTFCSISFFSTMISCAVAPPRFTMARLCLREMPTAPRE